MPEPRPGALPGPRQPAGFAGQRPSAADASLVGVLTLFALALRLWRASAPSLRGDEAFSALFASQHLPALLGQLRVAEPHPPLYYVGLHYWMRLAGDGELAVRLPSILVGTLLVPLAYALARTWSPGRPALLAALLVAVNPFLIWHSQDARMYTLLPAFATASLLFASRVLLGQPPRTADYVGLVAAGTLLLYTHYAGAYVLVAENVAAAWLATSARGKRVAALRWLAAQAAIALACLPWWVYAREVLLRREITWLGSLSLPALLERAWVAYSLGPTADPTLALALGAAFLPPLAVGLARWTRSRPGQALALYLLAPLVAAYLTSLRRPVFLDRYFVFVVPVYLAAVGAGLAAIGARSRALLVACLVAILGASAYVLAGYYLDPRQAKSPDWRGAGAFIASHYQPGDALVLNSPDPTLAYYVDRLADGARVPRETLPASPLDSGGAQTALARMASERDRIWTVPLGDPSWDADGAVEKWLAAATQPLLEERFGSLRVRLFATPRAMLAAHPRPGPISFAGQVEYLGYDLARAPSPGAPGAIVLRPGESLWLTLYFRATRTVEGDYRVFNHLVDAADRTRGQHDGVPVGGARPTAGWRVGEVIMDRHVIPVAPDAPTGSYRVRTGLYDPVTGQRLPVVGEGGRAVGDSVTIDGIRVER